MNKPKITSKIVIGGLILFLCVLAIMPVTPAFANSYTVNDSGDASDAKPGDGICATAQSKCTLRAALEEVNAHAGGDTINVPAMTIVLTKELWITYRKGYDKPVTIQGAGEGATIIDGNSRTRVFLVEGRKSTHSISNLTIRNGYNVSPPQGSYRPGFGGGIFVDSHLNLTNVTLSANTALEGGGIYEEFGFANPADGYWPVLNLNHVSVLYNSAQTTKFGFGGGGIVNGAELNANSVWINNNWAAIQGGGFYNNSYHPATFTNFTMNNNTSLDGAGMENDLGTVNLTSGVIDSNISYNSVQPNDGLCPGGGGIYNNLGNMVVQNVTVSNNVVECYSGMAGGISNLQNMALINVSITGNKAAYGAGIYNGSYLATNNQLTLRNVTISGNVGVNSKNPVVNSTGGGIYNNNGVIYSYSTTISNNSAEIAGGIANRNDLKGVANLRNTILATNIANWSTDCWGNITSMGHNLVGNPTGVSNYPCTFINKGSTDLTNVNPSLGPLTGSPAYQPLNQNSPAVDRGTNTDCLQQDIRGVPRPQGSSCDMGPYELVLKPFTPPQHPVYLPVVLK